MSYLSWTRAAYVLFVLSILAALIKVGGLADPQSLASRPADAEPAEVPEGRVVAQQAGSEPAPAGAASAEAVSAEAVSVEAVSAEQAPAPTRYVVWGSEDLQELEDLGVPTTSEAVERVGGGDDFAQNEDSGDGPLVFYRPRPDRPEDGAGRPENGAGGAAEDPPESGKVCGDLEQFPKSSKAVFPLSREHFDSYSDSWGAPRPQGSHEGVDLMVPSGTPEYAITDGTIVPVSGANGNGWNTLGGYTVMLQADYDVGPIKKGDLFYYAHMREESSLEIGTRVRAGQIVGYAGDTGEGPEGTRGLFPPHLHLGWYDTSGARMDLASGAMNPYPLLEWLRQNGGSVAGGSDAEYCEAPQSGAPTPSTGEGYWQYPDSPGTRPDMDTGADHARPSPVVPASATSAERAPDQQVVPGGNPDRPNGEDVREGRGEARPDAPARDPRENGGAGDLPADLPVVRDEAPFYGDRLSAAIRRIAENPRDLGAPDLGKWLDGFMPGMLDGDRPERRDGPDEKTEDEDAGDEKRAEPSPDTGAEKPDEPEKTNPVEEQEFTAEPEAEEGDGSATETQYAD
jgi:murein DD-endopeptidase MepM/ murein hydrolase activator NlpD